MRERLHSHAETVMKNKNPTIKDIARELNIHHATVSRALRDHPDVHPQTREKVLSMAKKLKYRPNIFAQNLKTDNTNFVGVIVPEIMHYFFASVISGIEEVGYENGYVIFVCQSNEEFKREITNVEALMSNKVAGMLVSVSQTTKKSGHFKNFIKSKGKLVFFDRVCPDVRAPKVIVDDYKGAFEATNFLVKKGHRRIVHITGDTGIFITDERLRGYKDALEYNGIPFDQNLVYYSGFHEKHGMSATKHFINEKSDFTAIFAVNDPVALGAYEVLKKEKIRIPDDVAVIGFSNDPISAIVEPSLTTVEQPAYQMGVEAMKLLISQIKNDDDTEITTKVLPTKLIIRDSV